MSPYGQASALGCHTVLNPAVIEWWRKFASTAHALIGPRIYLLFHVKHASTVMHEDVHVIFCNLLLLVDLDAQIS